MVEPLPYHREADGSLRLLKDVASLSRAIAIASGLGTTSAYTWLKMPSCDEPGRGLRDDDAAVRGARRGAAPRPGRGPRVLGPRAHPAGRARPGRGPRAALPARRRGVRARSTRPPACCARQGSCRERCSARRTTAVRPAWSSRSRPRTPAGTGPGCGCSGWRRASRSVVETGGSELFVLPLAGSLRVTAGDQAFDLQGRDSVFTRVTDFCYVGRDSGRRAGVRGRRRGRAAVVALRARAPAGVRRGRGRPGRGARRRAGHPPGHQLRRARASGTTPTS